MKNKKGITIIELVVVIIILVLLAIIAIWNTNGTIRRAEAATIMNEFKAIYSAATVIKENYNNFIDYSPEPGLNYCEITPDPSGDWYTVYGVEALKDEDTKAKFNDTVITEGLGIDELKRSYDFRWRDNNGNDLKDIEVRFHDGKMVDVAGYRVRTYEELQAVRGEITK